MRIRWQLFQVASCQLPVASSQLPVFFLSSLRRQDRRRLPQWVLDFGLTILGGTGHWLLATCRWLEVASEPVASSQ